MSAPTALTETYIPCIGTTFTLGGAPNTAVLKIIEGGLTASFGVDEMTNNSSGGYEDVKTYRTVKGSFTGTFVSGSPPIMKAGDIFAVAIANGTDVDITGNFRFNDIEYPALNIKEGIKYKFSVMGQGAITGC